MKFHNKKELDTAKVNELEKVIVLQYSRTRILLEEVECRQI